MITQEVTLTLDERASLLLALQDRAFTCHGQAQNCERKGFHESAEYWREEESRAEKIYRMIQNGEVMA